MPHLETPPSMNILYETKAAFSEAELQILSKARVNYIQPGIEALDSSLLKLMRKGSTSFNNIRLLMNCRKHRIHPMWNLLVGFPGEDPGLYAAYQRNLPKMAHLPPPTGVYTVRFDRFSPYFNKAQEYDLDLQPMPFYELAYPFPKESLKNLAYFFVNSNYNLEYLGPLSHHIAPLEGLVRTWRSLWDSRDAKRPMLYQEVVGDETVIYDSRFSEERRYAISGAATGILKALARPKTLQDLSIIMDELSAEELEREMDFLKVNDLLFEEKGYWMNLVFDQHPMDEDDPAFAKAPH